MVPIDTKSLLMQTALELIWSSNYDSVGIAEICKQANVTKGAFYHHFTSKADLFVSACTMDWENTSRALDEVLSPRYSAIQQLHNIISLILTKQVRVDCDGNVTICGCPVFTAGAQAGCGCDEIGKVARTMSDNGSRYFAALARNLETEGCLNSSGDAAAMGRLMEQFVQGLMMHGRVHQDFDQLRHDLQEGLYRILDVKAEYRNSELPAMQTLAEIRLAAIA